MCSDNIYCSQLPLLLRHWFTITTAKLKKKFRSTVCKWNTGVFITYSYSNNSCAVMFMSTDILIIFTALFIDLFYLWRAEARWWNEMNCAALMGFIARNISTRQRPETNQCLTNEEKERALITLSTWANIWVEQLPAHTHTQRHTTLSAFIINFQGDILLLFLLISHSLSTCSTILISLSFNNQSWVYISLHAWRNVSLSHWTTAAAPDSH